MGLVNSTTLCEHYEKYLHGTFQILATTGISSQGWDNALTLGSCIISSYLYCPSTLTS